MRILLSARRSAVTQSTAGRWAVDHGGDARRKRRRRAAQRRSLWGSLAQPFQFLAPSASVSAVPLRSPAWHPGALHHGTHTLTPSAQSLRYSLSLLRRVISRSCPYAPHCTLPPLPPRTPLERSTLEEIRPNLRGLAAPAGAAARYPAQEHAFATRVVRAAFAVCSCRCHVEDSSDSKAFQTIGQAAFSSILVGAMRQCDSHHCQLLQPVEFAVPVTLQSTFDRCTDHRVARAVYASRSSISTVASHSAFLV